LIGNRIKKFLFFFSIFAKNDDGTPYKKVKIWQKKFFSKFVKN